MLELFREVVNGNITDYTIKDPLKLEEVARELGIEMEGREIKDIATDLYQELERTYIQVEGEIPFAKRVPAKTLETWRKQGIVPRGAMREIMELMTVPTWAWTSITKISPSSAAEPRWPTAGAGPWWPPKFRISSSAPPPR